jgi:hypothetical protein
MQSLSPFSATCGIFLVIGMGRMIKLTSPLTITPDESNYPIPVRQNSRYIIVNIISILKLEDK